MHQRHARAAVSNARHPCTEAPGRSCPRSLKRSCLRSVSGSLQEQAAEQVPEREEHEDHERDGDRSERDQREVGRAVAVQSVAPLRPGGRSRSAMR
jgi:hypothetical protein